MTLGRNTDGTLLQTQIDAGTRPYRAVQGRTGPYRMLVRLFPIMDRMLSEPHNTFITIRLLVPDHYIARYFYLPI